MLSLFKKRDLQIYGDSNHSTSESEYSENSSSQDYTDDDNYTPDYELIFDKQLSSGALVFTIVDEDNDNAGYVIVSANGTVTPLPSGFFEFDEEDIDYLKNKAKEFFNAL